MATMVDAKSEYKGEGKVWESLRTHLPPNVIVYNNREVEGREYDFCLLCEGMGILIIEVKGWLSSKIRVKGIDNIEIEGYLKPERSPKKQARVYHYYILNQMIVKFGQSPLVCDVVCYPFITKAEYQEAGLNIISEPFLTIFKEDLEDEQLLIKKIQGVFESFRHSPHADLSSRFIARIRQEWEPQAFESLNYYKQEIPPYSVLSVHPYALSHAEIAEIVNDYFSGIKRIVFLGERQSYEELITILSERFERHNIQAASGNLSIGYEKPIQMSEDSTRVFNFEIYYVRTLPSIVKESVVVEEGVCSAGQERVLRSLASTSAFNVQQYFVEHGSPDKNLLVQAGAGTGKTYSMVSRIAFLCGKRVKPVMSLVDDIAMMTFTNDAATNMKVRLKQMFVNYYILTGEPKYLVFVDEVDQASISTIHSFTIRALRRDVLYTGLGTNFRIASDALMRGALYDMYLSQYFDEKTQENPDFALEIPVPIYELRTRLMGLANNLLQKSVNLEKIRPEDMGVSAAEYIPYFNELIECVVIPAEHAYTEELSSRNDLDLKESIIRFGSVLEQRKTHIKDLRIRYLFIDEFQDTDDVQIRVFARLQQLVNSECRFFIVGDLKQSIYRFRGATLSAFDRLRSISTFEWQTYDLTLNYRTDKRLLDQYHAIFSNMGEHKYLPYAEPGDRLFSNVNTGIDDEHIFTCVPYHGKADGALETAFIETLKEQIGLLQVEIRKGQLSRAERTIAILVRSNWQIDVLVHVAREHEITVETNSGGNLFQLQSTLDLYRLVSALRNSYSAPHLVNLIESNFVDLSLDYQRYRDAKPAECVQDLTRILDEFFYARMGRSWREVVADAYTQPILFVIKQIYDGLQPWKQYSNFSAKRRHYIMNYEYLVERIIKQSRVDALTLNRVAEFLRVNILTGQEQASREFGEDGEGIKVICTTVHKSKGLEYGTVILPYTYDDIASGRKIKFEANYTDTRLSYITTFKNRSSEYNSNFELNTEKDEQLAEESRILYVALTRAIRNCVWLKDLDRTAMVSWASLLEV